MEKAFVLTEGDLHIPCKLSAPSEDPVRRIVLSVHGFGGSMEDTIQQGIAEEMKMFYGATFRFDFPAHGVNELGSEGLTLHNCEQTLLAVARQARNTYPEISDLCIFATGFGAYITLSCLERLLRMPGTIRLVLQTPAVLAHETILAMKQINRETLWAMDEITFAAPRPFSVNYRFYEDLSRNIVLTTHPIPMLILQGEEDAYVRHNDIQQFRRINEQSKLVIIPGASHRFLEAGAWDMVLDLTRDWFEYEQVLCCDWQ